MITKRSKTGRRVRFFIMGLLTALLSEAAHAAASRTIGSKKSRDRVSRAKKFSFDPLHATTQLTMESQFTHRMSVGERIQAWVLPHSKRNSSLLPPVRLWLEGMIEVGNRSEFNVGLFPNHWWRGTARGGGELHFQSGIFLGGGLAHESVHPTGGIRMAGTEELEAFDGEWRTIDLNRATFSLGWQNKSFSLSPEAFFLFLSRNQPEVDSNSKGAGWGLAGNASFETTPFPSSPLRLGVSAFAEHVFANQQLALSTNGDSLGPNIRSQTRLIAGAYVKRRRWTVSLSVLEGRPIGFYVSDDRRTLLNLSIGYSAD